MYRGDASEILTWRSAESKRIRYSGVAICLACIALGFVAGRIAAPRSPPVASP
jgi:hypothetical protein